MAGRTPEPDDDREPTPDADDVDLKFAEITAGLGDFTLPPDEPHAGHVDDEPEDARPPAPVDPGPRDFTLGPEVDVEDGEEPGYQPPDPPSITGADPLLALGWVGVVVPIVLVFLYLMLWRDMPVGLLVLGGFAFVLSVGLLVWRMPSSRDPDDHDDGAVV
jgi:hypothetical protein